MDHQSYSTEPTTRDREQENYKVAEQGTDPREPRPPNLGMVLFPSEELSLDNIEDAFLRYTGRDGYEADRCQQIRETLLMAAKTMLRTAPRSPRRTMALQHLISANMDAIAAISSYGRF